MMENLSKPEETSEGSELNQLSMSTSEGTTSIPKNRNLERIRSNIKNSLFNIGKSVSFQGFHVEEPQPQKITPTPSMESAPTGREKMNQIRANIKMKFFPNARSTQSFGDLGNIESTPKSELDSGLDKKLESPYSDELSLEANGREYNSDPTYKKGEFAENGYDSNNDLDLKSREEGKSANEIDPVLEENEYTSDEDGEGSEPLYDPSREGFKHSIFFHNIEDEIDDLKRELEVEEGEDIHFIQGDFFNYYSEEEMLGEGTTATVKRCIQNDTGKVFAVKIVHYRDDLEILVLMVKEFRNHYKLDHKNIIRVYEMYIDYFTKKIYTIMELAECQEMFEVLQDLGHYSEAVASHIFKQILTGINYLHSHGVCHRDLKPNNLLVSKDGSIVKITDFNVSKFIEKKGKKYSSLSTENYKMWTYTGTIAFTAPEVFIGTEYTEAVDMWSAGVVLYTMLCGYQPFQAEYVHELIDIIKNGSYEFHSDPWDNISEQAKDLVRHCLDVNYKSRYSSSQALIHPWISNYAKLPTAKIGKTVDNLKRNASRLTIGANEGEGNRIMRISTASWDNGFPFEFQRREKKAGTLNLEENDEKVAQIKKLETMHVMPHVTEKYYNQFSGDYEQFPECVEEQDYEDTPKGDLIDFSRHESIPKSFTAYELVLKESYSHPSKDEDSK